MLRESGIPGRCDCRPRPLEYPITRWSLYRGRILVDCDDDTVLVRVTRLGDGNVCHTGDRSCFSRSYEAPKQK